MAEEIIHLTTEDVIEQLQLSIERFGSFHDNFRQKRYRAASANLYYAVESLCRALLFSINICPQTHQEVHRMISYYFIRTGILPTETGTYLTILYRRQKNAEYSMRVGWEFDEKAVQTYFDWAYAITNNILDYMLQNCQDNDLNKNLTELKNKIKSCLESISESKCLNKHLIPPFPSH